MEVDELGHLLCREAFSCFAEKLVGGVGKAFVALECAAGFDGDVEFDQSERRVGEEVEGVAVGQGVFLRFERLERRGLQHGGMSFFLLLKGGA